MTVLTLSQIRQFTEEGFLLFDPQIPEDLIDGAVADLDGLYGQPRNSDGVLPPCRIQDAWKLSRNVHQLAVWPRIMEALNELYRREPRPFQTLNFPTGTLQKAHSDSIHFSSCPSEFMTGVWLGLETIDEDNGPVFYYPGSHRLPMFDMADVGVASEEELYHEYESFIAGVVKHFGLEKKQATMPKGHVFLWSANLLHGGDNRRDLLRSRHSMVTHVYYEDCRYYTPMMSRGLDICWREPEFIPREVDSFKRKTVQDVYIKNDTGAQATPPGTEQVPARPEMG